MVKVGHVLVLSTFLFLPRLALKETSRYSERYHYVMNVERKE